MRCTGLVLAGVLFAADVHGQALLRDADGPPPTAVATARPNDGTPQVFKAGVDLVALNVVVTDSGSKFVTGLQQQDFAVFEDGVQQDLSFFAASAVPLDLAILLDTSSSMTDKLQEVQQAATGFAATLRDGDRAMIVDIKDATKVLQPLSGDIDAAKAAIATTSAKGGTALFNGIYLTLKELIKQRRQNDDVRRQAIVVLSDGEDTASLVSFDDVMAQAKETGIAIYTITLRSPFLLQTASAIGRTQARYFSEAEYSMKALAQETGARSFFPTAVTELSGVYGSIAEELASQYALGYTSKNPRRDGAFRRLTVRIADHPGVASRTRSGYIAPRADRKAGAN
jgi:Ca-activated chloride channel family protein